MNHTANESEWIYEHAEATYSCFTMPHLRPAFLLDVIFGWATRDVSSGSLENVGVPTLVENDDHIQALRHYIHTVYLPKANLSQFYQCDIEKYIQLFSEKVEKISLTWSLKKIKFDHYAKYVHYFRSAQEGHRLQQALLNRRKFI